MKYAELAKERTRKLASELRKRMAALAAAKSQGAQMREHATARLADLLLENVESILSALDAAAMEEK